MGAAKRYLSANEYLRDVWRLAAAVRGGGWRPDILIALWRGGAPVGVAIHEFLKTTGWDMRHLAVKCCCYTGIGETADTVTFECAGEVLGSIRPGERVLFVDDVFDTGKTAAAVRGLMERRGIEMRLATVYWKRPCNKTNLAPDYFVKDVSGDWIVFPHEIEGLTPDELVEKDPELADLSRGIS